MSQKSDPETGWLSGGGQVAWPFLDLWFYELWELKGKDCKGFLAL